MNEKVYVIGYARVSSPKQAQIGEGLEVQEQAIKRYCEKMGWTLFPTNKVFQEPFTGTNTNRPVYKDILEILKSNKEAINIKHFVFWDFDRLTRAGTIDYDQIWNDVKNYGVSLRDTTGVIQEEKDAFEHFGLKKKYNFAVARPSEDTERQKVEDARKDRIKILKRLIEPEIRLTQEGYHIGRPDYGFENKKVFVENKKKCIQVRYEPEAKFIERLYQLRAEGILTDEEIANILNLEGYKSKLMVKWSKNKTKQIGTIGGNTLTVKHLQDIIKRTTYCGVICEEWTNHLPIRAKYKGLVGIETWNKANKGKVFLQENNNGSLELLKDVGVHGKKRFKYNPKFPYKGVLKCELCGKTMKGSASTGKSGDKFGAYHCERNHKRNAFSETEVKTAFNNLFESMQFTPDFLDILEKTLIWQFRQKEGESAEHTIKANNNVAELESQKLNYIKSFTTATLPEVQRSIEEEIVKLQKQIEEAKKHRDSLEIKEGDIVEFIAWCRKIMEHPYKILEDIRSSDEQRELFSLFFEELPTYTEIVSGTPKMTFVFKVNSEFLADKSALVTPRRIELRLLP